MPLESLRQPFNPDEPGRKLREVQTVEHEEQRVSAAEKKYHELEDSIYYNKEDESWFEDDHGDQKAHDQLVGIMALAEFDQKAAKEKLGKLYKSKFYQEGWVTLENGFERRNLPDDVAQLYAIAVTAMFNPEEAISAYKKLLDTGSEEMLPGILEYAADGMSIYTNRELLHVLIQTYLNPTAAQERYNQLKSSTLWIPEFNMWNFFPENAASLEETECTTSDLLLSFVIELKLGMTGVKEKYERARQSGLYDTEKQMWYNGRGWNRIWMRHVIEDALLSVIIESQLEKQEQPAVNNPLQIPEERNF